MSKTTGKQLLPTEIADIEQFQRLVHIQTKDGMNKQEIMAEADITQMTLDKIINSDADTLNLRDKTMKKITGYVRKNRGLLPGGAQAKPGKVTQAEIDRSVEDAKKWINSPPANGTNFWLEFGKLTKNIPKNTEITITIKNN
jgi:hypothetical protein